jgi:hypothetical protein
MSIRPTFRWFSSVASVLGSIATDTFSAVISPVKPAETVVVVRKGILKLSISVADLRELAETGKVPQKLQAYANLLSSEQRSQIVRALQAKIPLNVVALTNLLNTSHRDCDPDGFEYSHTQARRCRCGSAASGSAAGSEGALRLIGIEFP